MNLFSQSTPKTDPAKLKQIKSWVYECFRVDPDIPISINQLRCSEPGCPPIETVIGVMSTPIRQVKIHKSVAEIERNDISRSVLE